MNKAKLTEALRYASVTDAEQDTLRAAARLVERLLPGECAECGGNGKVFARNPFAHFVDPTHLDECPNCHGSGRVWDEGIVEAVAEAISDDNSMYKRPDQLARAVLSALGGVL